jgi:hypothetical protein
LHLALLTMWVPAFATTSLSIKGKVVQIKNKKVEIRSQSGLNKLIFKNLTKSDQDKVHQAMREKREIELLVTPDMLARK